MNRRRRLLILLPGGQPHKLALGAKRISFREAPLTGVILAALVPPELDVDTVVVLGQNLRHRRETQRRQGLPLGFPA